MKENNKSVTNTIRSKAEEIINNRPNIDSYTNMSEVEIKKLIHDLEVHQIELEMINEELVAQNKAEEIATDKYVELYDFAPSGYFTLSKIGEIIELNLSGAKILGSERLKLKNSHFGSFVSKDSKQDFNLFLENIFHSHSIESCSLSILDNDNPDIRVHVTGIISQNLEQCQITAVDISENWYEHQKLIQSQDKYAKAFLTTTYGVIISRVDDGKLIEINDAFCKITGYSRDEALASTSQSLDLWIDIEDRNKVVKALRETGRFSEMEFRFRKKNGEVIIGAMSSSLVNINNENCILSSINDITERKKAEEKLLESELQYRTLADSGQALIWTATPDKKCDYFNKVWLNFTGRTIEQELGDGWAEGVHPDDLDMCFDIFTTSFDKRVDFSMTYRMRRFDGEYRWILDEGKPRYNMLGEFIGYIGNCLDITNMKESEEKIKQSEEKYRTIIESQSEGIGIVNEKEVFTFANQAACRIFDCEHLEEMSLFDFLTPTETEKINQQTLHRQNGISNNYELQITTQKGNVKYISVSSEPKFNANSIYEGAYAVFRDVTERKLAQDALTLSEEKYRKDLSLLNSIFESPINIIVFSLDINYCYTAFTKYHSQTMKAIWGVDIQLGMSMLDIISNEDDKGKAKRNFDRVLKDDYFVLTEEYGDDALFRTYYENFYSPVKNNHGEIVGLSVFVIDATARNQATKKLEISEDRFRKVVEQTSDLIAIADSNGFITYASSTSISMFQLSPEEMVGVNFMEFAALDEIDKAKNAFRKILEGGETINDSVFRMKRNGGELFYAELNGSKFETASQNGVLVTIRDITERKRIEENIKAKTSILSNLIINLKEGILLENSSREIELTNQLFCDMFGIPAPPDAMRGADCTESAEQSKMLFKNPDKFVEDIHQILANKVAVFNDELELVDGRYFERDYIPTYLDDVYSGHLWKYRDITEKKNAEIELKKISQAIEQSPFMTVITRVDGTIEYINPSITRITGYSKDDLIGQNPNVLSSGELSQKDYQTLWPTISSGKEWKGEFHNKKKNGEFYWAGALILPIFDVNGKITHYLSIEEDITQRKEIEMQLLELNTNLELKVEERTIQLNEAKKKLENELHERILIEVDLRWNKSLLELMSNSSPLGFLVVDNRTDDILYFNHRFCKIWNIEHIEDQMEQGKFKNNEIIPYCLPVLADVPAFAESCKPLQFEHNRDVIEDEIAFTDNRTIRRFSTQIRGENDEYFGR
ncbi:MAG: PAS domain S-box protein, partial [Paludibacter sp.]